MPGEPAEQEAKTGVAHTLRAWGENPLPPTLTATLITAQHMRPFQALPMLFPPVLLLSSYMSVSDLKKDAAGVSAAWSGLYILLAQRRKQRLYSKFGARGLVRGATLGMCAVNLAGGGLAYAFGQRNDE